MKRLADDTPIEIERIQVELVRQLTPGEKMQRMISMNEDARLIVTAGVRRQYPDVDKHEFRLLVAARWLPPSLMIAAFGRDPYNRK